MHVSAPNFDICVTLSVGIKHAAVCSNAQASGKRTPACTTLTVNWLENLCKRLAVIDVDQVLVSCPGLFIIHFIMHMAEERHGGKTLTYLSLLCLPTTWMHACRPIWHLLCQQPLEKFITGLVLPHLPSSFRHDSTLHSHPLRNLFHKQGINTRAHKHRWSPRCSGVTLQHALASAPVFIAWNCAKA